MMDYKKDLAKSIRYLKSVQPLIEALIGAKLKKIEGSEDDLYILLDTKSGIDYIGIDKAKNYSIYGIAARIQEGKQYDSFTIRSERKSGHRTELVKRQEQIANGDFYPKLTLQVYFDYRGSLSSMAFIKTKLLFDFIENHPKLVDKKETFDSEFLVVYWKDLKEKGYFFKSYYPELPY